MEMAALVDQYFDKYIDRYGDTALPGHLKTLRAILRCRTPESGELYRDGQSTGLRYDHERGLYLDAASTSRTRSVAGSGWDYPDTCGYSDYDDLEEDEYEPID